jgi:hypothetical protein
MEIKEGTVLVLVGNDAIMILFSILANTTKYLALAAFPFLNWKEVKYIICPGRNTFILLIAL